jgi:aminoglycoside/choline kinase family phosphotransferase
VTSRPPPSELLNWALTVLAPSAGGSIPELTVVAGDASNRRYFRAEVEGISRILVDSPPATEKNTAFLAVRELLAGAGVRVPTLHAADLDRGYLILEDLGNRLLLAELDASTADDSYHIAMDVLLQVAALDTHTMPLDSYNEALLTQELGRFPAWFAEALLGQTLDDGERALLKSCFDRLIASALEQPRVLVHRDFHSRNLMPQADGSLGVIDFQDAVLGPVTYDPVSLLRDCYIQWPEQQVEGWALAYRTRLAARGLPGGEADDKTFLRWFDLMGLQRHIKVLGTFARLYLRDEKSAYLDDLPLVVRYVLEIAGKYAGSEPEIAAFHHWFESKLSPVIARQDWSATP